jgi:hypothetical protein
LSGCCACCDEQHPTSEVPLEEQPAQDSDSLESANPRLDPKSCLLRYCGNISAAAKVFAQYPINTDDHPVIEYQAPVTHLRHDARETSWLIGRELLSFFERLFEVTPPESHEIPGLGSSMMAQVSFSHLCNMVCSSTQSFS